MRVDLNLLTSLNALLEERSVSRAAERLGLSQPTLSTSLRRLRHHFNDELLARAGNAYTLTPLAEELLESTSRALASTERVFDTRAAFVPETAKRDFTLVMSDAHLTLFGRALAEITAHEAPGVQLRFEHSTARRFLPGNEWLREVDAVVVPHGVLADLPSMDLYHDRWVCIVARESGLPTPSELLERPWVATYQPRASVQTLLHRMRHLGIEPRTTISTEDFLAVPSLVVGTDRVGLVPERIAALAVATTEVSIVEPPGDLGALVEAMWWHPAHERDPGHRWLRQVAARATRSLALEGFAR